MSETRRRVLPSLPPRPVEPGTPYRILLVSSSGGHLSQLLQLRPWWSVHERTWVCFDTADAVDALAGEHWVRGHFPTTRNIPNLLRNLVLALGTLRKVRPDLIVSDGAGLAVPFFWLSRLFRSRTIYLEVYDRIDSPTMTGRLVGPVTDLMVVQWDQQVDCYPGATVAGPLY